MAKRKAKSANAFELAALTTLRRANNTPPPRAIATGTSFPKTASASNGTGLQRSWLAGPIRSAEGVPWSGGGSVAIKGKGSTPIGERVNNIRRRSR